MVKTTAVALFGYSIADNVWNSTHTYPYVAVTTLENQHSLGSWPPKNLLRNEINQRYHIHYNRMWALYDVATSLMIIDRLS